MYFYPLSKGMKDILDEEQFIKEKSAVIVVEIAKREWGLSWIDFDKYLQSLTQTGPQQLEIVYILLIIISYTILLSGSDYLSNISSGHTHIQSRYTKK